MTLAIAACFPWGRFKAMRESLPGGVKMDQGIIIATDSRFTYGKTRFDDAGRKGLSAGARCMRRVCRRRVVGAASAK